MALREVSRVSGGNNGLSYFYSDHLGSNSALQKPNGTLAYTWYLPFGGYRPGSAPTQTITDRDFTGQRENMELGLLYYGARFYVPGLGRFASADSIIPNPANPQSYNRYSYVLNRALNFTDPTGHIETPFDQTGGGGPVAGDDERTEGTGNHRLDGTPGNSQFPQPTQSSGSGSTNT